MFPDAFLKGIQEFNSQEFFQCHETLEELWNRQQGQEKELTQALIQIAVGCYHWQRGNFKGAVKLFNRGLGRLKSQDFALANLDLANLDIDGLISQVNQALKSAEAQKLPSAYPVIRIT